jgi:cell division protein FtsQ
VPIDPRIRERRIEVIREAGRRRLRITLIVASAIVVIGLAYLATQSPLLDVDHIRVMGARRETASEVEAAAGVHTGDALLFVDTGAVAKRVERLPWVAHASVHRELPGTLKIVVTDFAPAAFIRAPGDRFALVAVSGRVIAIVKTVPASTVEIRGEKTVPPVGSLVSPPQVAGAVRHLPARLAERVRAIDVGTVFVLELRTGGQVRLGTLDDLPQKGAAALAVLDHLGATPFQYIDVSAPQAPVSR